ncbi:PqqD family peptide modification chaperone [Kibdelosporangium persicum]|uniref:Coenzyme PQQ synthesis protein D (PqqD) n=1 Tax=Kibdelosporangium persicum TaxID=2698649 RepID=A0ABX2F8C9_9PSEU|nr:Coenzyme PQQ synthesis protein D (PqqD) [Kibdelosporangium persicum]
MRAAVFADGRMELSGDGTIFHCGPVGTAMWVALCQHDWQIDAAADLLAGLWRLDVENMRTDLVIWVDELWDAGVLRHHS